MFVLKNNKFYLWLQALSILIAAFIGLSILLLSKNLPNKLPLFYSLPWGDNQLATHQQFFIIPAIIMLIALGNLAISWHLHLSQTFFKKILMISSLINTLILSLTYLKIIFIFI
ncbi:hypothetical protein HYT18_03600 [Candidatus Microgenomates bacterium]|nr:hypothetical protein [Candidatus Microgenomates bacterium]